MKVLGLVVEYNPFHNGHLYHLEKSRSLCNADAIICVMSGNFIQRGEPSIVNKWARTKMALLSGVDLVIELPAVFAMSSAEYFAFGAVKILESLGLVDFICFGSESGSIEELCDIADILYNEPPEYRANLKQALDAGLSYPAARERAVSSYINQKNLGTHGLDQIMGASNNILGLEYLKALKKLKSSIKPLTIKRINNAYNCREITGSISSATAIRRQINENSIFEEAISGAVPDESLKVLENEFENGRGPVTSNDFEAILLSMLRKMSKDQISHLPYMGEGLENRFKTAAEHCGTIDELVEYISTRRYTRTRIQRSLFSILTGLTASELDTFMKHGGPQYIRVLGFNPTGRQLLSHINKSTSLPVILKTADFKKSCNPLLTRMLEIEASSTDMYVLGYKNSAFRKAGQEFTQNVVRLL